jgi:NADH-quinone oxidoreductase subunit H
MNLLNSLKFLESFLNSEFFKVLIKAEIFPGTLFISLLVYFTVWLERKLLARVMIRIGPLHVGKYAGILQILADFLKLISKERIVPKKADRLIFITMPIAAVMIASLPLAVIPFDEYWYIFKSDYSLLYFLAIYSLFPIVDLSTGWASNNKYSFIGGIRSGYQMLGYEVPLYLATASIVIAAKSLNLIDIVKAQSEVWFILLQPLGFLTFFLSILAELERSPFDIPEAEQEIVIGWITEYSGIYFGLMFFSIYLRFCISAMLLTTLFLGGWLMPSILLKLFPGAFWFVIKSVIVIALIILIRGAFPRIRLDQLLNFGWKILAPLALINLFITSIIVLI